MMKTPEIVVEIGGVKLLAAPEIENGACKGCAVEHVQRPDEYCAVLDALCAHHSIIWELKEVGLAEAATKDQGQ